MKDSFSQPDFLNHKASTMAKIIVLILVALFMCFALLCNHGNALSYDHVTSDSSISVKLEPKISFKFDSYRRILQSKTSDCDPLCCVPIQCKDLSCCA